jgi:hypothetical protein
VSPLRIDEVERFISRLCYIEIGARANLLAECNLSVDHHLEHHSNARITALCGATQRRRMDAERLAIEELRLADRWHECAVALDGVSVQMTLPLADA